MTIERPVGDIGNRINDCNKDGESEFTYRYVVVLIINLHALCEMEKLQILSVQFRIY
jgi:hypothetical protein